LPSAGGRGRKKAGNKEAGLRTGKREEKKVGWTYGLAAFFLLVMIERQVQ